MLRGVTVCKTYSFCGAHHLPGYNGKCANDHGHTWKVEVSFNGPVRENGMVVDFHAIDALMERPLEKLDHTNLNDTLQMPTAENIAIWFKEEIQLRIRALDAPDIRVFPLLVKVRVWESPEAYAEVISAN